MSSAAIRDFLPPDFDATVALLHDCGLGRAPNNPEHDVERILQAGDSRIFVVDRDAGGLIGIVVAANDGRRGWIYYLAVHPEARGTGLGARLVHHAEAWLQQRGAPKVLLLIRDDNLAVMDFYRELGYVEEPCTCMGRWLTPPNAPPEPHSSLKA